MPYDKELDECVFVKSWENDDERLTASIYSYNNGDKETAAHQREQKQSGWLQVCQVGKIGQRRDRSSSSINRRSTRSYGLG